MSSWTYNLSASSQGYLNTIFSVNVVSCDEHVPVIEHFIRVIKERCCASIAMLPFDLFPRQLNVSLLKTVVFYINAFPWSSGASQEFSPLTIVEGFVLDYHIHFQAILGEYGQTYECTTDNIV